MGNNQDEQQHSWDGPQLAQDSCFLCWADSDEQLAWDLLWKINVHTEVPEVFWPVVRDLAMARDELANPADNGRGAKPIAVQLARSRGLQVGMIGLPILSAEDRQRLRLCDERDRRRVGRAKVSNARRVRAQEAVVVDVDDCEIRLPASKRHGHFVRIKNVKKDTCTVAERDRAKLAHERHVKREEIEKHKAVSTKNVAKKAQKKATRSARELSLSRKAERKRLCQQ